MVFCGLALELAPAGYGLAELGWDRQLGIHREAQLGIEKCREAQQEAAVKTLPPSHMLMLIANWSRKCKISWTKGCCRQTHNLFNSKSIATLTETISTTFLPLCQPQRKSWVKKMLSWSFQFQCELCKLLWTNFLQFCGNSLSTKQLRSCSFGRKKHLKANSRQNSTAKVPSTNATIIFATCSLHLHSSPSAFCCTKGLIASLGGAPMKAWVVVHIFPRLKLSSLVVE